LVREEIKRRILRERAGKIAWGFEKGLEGGKGSEVTRLCWNEMRKRSMEGKGGSKGRRRERNSLRIGDGGRRK